MQYSYNVTVLDGDGKKGYKSSQKFVPVNISLHVWQGERGKMGWIFSSGYR